jgi:isochorismate hydrolase
MKNHNINVESAALLVVDMQQYFLTEKSHAFVPMGKTIVPNIQQFIFFFRKNKRPVIYTRFAVAEGEKDLLAHWWQDSVQDGSPEGQITTELEPNPEEKIIRKTSYGSFYGTDLEKYLTTHNVTDLVITGVLTNLCCEEAAREAFARGFNVFFIDDATATYEEDVHLASLKNIAYGFATLFSTKELLQSCTVL